jgi:hypothetical protein
MVGRTQTSLNRFLLSMTVVLLSCTLARANNDWKRDLGRENHIAYIVLDHLKSGRDTPQIFPNDFNLPFSTFYKDLKWQPNECWAGSTLKEGVSVYCLPYARLGKYYPNARNPNENIFSPMGACAGLYVWHNAQENKYYFWSVCWNVAGVLGPFIGDPRMELPHAVMPRKGQRSFRGVKLTVVSQRWVYPNPEDARVPPDEHYDCAHGHLSGREVERLRLNSFITRLRLTNGSQKDIYYQTENNGSDKPATCGLRSDLQNKWDQALKMDYECDLAGDAWAKLAPGASIEFDKSDQAFAKGVVGFVVLLNEKPSYWDPSKLLGTYPTMYGRH